MVRVRRFGDKAKGNGEPEVESVRHRLEPVGNRQKPLGNRYKPVENRLEPLWNRFGTGCMCLRLKVGTGWNRFFGRKNCFRAGIE
jgi:hypothetical protein